MRIRLSGNKVEAVFNDGKYYPNTIEVTSIPDLDIPEGKTGYLVYNQETGAVEAVYEDIPIIPIPPHVPTPEEQIAELQKQLDTVSGALDDIIMNGLPV